MKFILAALIGLLIFSQAYSQNHFEKLLLTPEEATEGMTPEMKKKYLQSEIEKKKRIAEYEALTPEERAKKDQENKKILGAPDFQKKMKEGIDKMTAEDKKMLEIVMQNTFKKMAKLKDPNSKEFKLLNELNGKKDERSVKEKIENPASKYDLYNAAIDIADSSVPIEGAEDYLIKISKSDNKEAFKGVSFALDKTVSPIKDPALIFHQMVISPSIDTETLQFITDKYYGSRKKMKVDPATLRSIINNKNVNVETLITLIGVLSVNDVAGKAEIKKMLDVKFSSII